MQHCPDYFFKNSINTELLMFPDNALSFPSQLTNPTHDNFNTKLKPHTVCLHTLSGKEVPRDLLGEIPLLQGKAKQQERKLFTSTVSIHKNQRFPELFSIIQIFIYFYKQFYSSVTSSKMEAINIMFLLSKNISICYGRKQYMF